MLVYQFSLTQFISWQIIMTLYSLSAPCQNCHPHPSSGPLRPPPRSRHEGLMPVPVLQRAESVLFAHAQVTAVLNILLLFWNTWTRVPGFHRQQCGSILEYCILTAFFPKAMGWRGVRGKWEQAAQETQHRFYGKLEILCSSPNIYWVS